MTNTDTDVILDAHGAKDPSEVGPFVLPALRFFVVPIPSGLLQNDKQRPGVIPGAKRRISGGVVVILAPNPHSNLSMPGFLLSMS